MLSRKLKTGGFAAVVAVGLGTLLLGCNAMHVTARVRGPSRRPGPPAHGWHPPGRPWSAGFARASQLRAGRRSGPAD
jgi:hypothetical protein